MHISNELVRSARVAVNESDSLEQAQGHNPFKATVHKLAWESVTNILWSVREMAPDNGHDLRWRSHVRANAKRRETMVLSRADKRKIVTRMNVKDKSPYGIVFARLLNIEKMVIIRRDQRLMDSCAECWKSIPSEEDSVAVAAWADKVNGIVLVEY